MLLILVFKYVVKNGWLSGSVILKISGLLILSSFDGSLLVIVFFNVDFFVFIKMVKVVFICFVFFIVKIGSRGLLLIELISFMCIGVKFWCSLVMMRGRKVVFRIKFVVMLLMFKMDRRLDVIVLEIKLFKGINMIYVMILVINSEMVGVIMILSDWGIKWWINCLV